MIATSTFIIIFFFPPNGIILTGETNDDLYLFLPPKLIYSVGFWVLVFLDLPCSPGHILIWLMSTLELSFTDSFYMNGLNLWLLASGLLPPLHVLVNTASDYSQLTFQQNCIPLFLLEPLGIGVCWCCLAVCSFFFSSVQCTHFKSFSHGFIFLAVIFLQVALLTNNLHVTIYNKCFFWVFSEMHIALGIRRFTTVTGIIVWFMLRIVDVASKARTVELATEWSI